MREQVSLLCEPSQVEIRYRGRVASRSQGARSAEGLKEGAEAARFQLLEADRALLEPPSEFCVYGPVGSKGCVQRRARDCLADCLRQGFPFRPVVVEKGVVSVEEEPLVGLHWAAIMGENAAEGQGGSRVEIPHWRVEAGEIAGSR
jgi:hypothetical protein